MRDPKTENFLAARGFAFEFVPDMPIAEIDCQEADANPARLRTKLEQDRAISYGIAMEEGADFPAIVSLDVADGRLKRLITGRHRIAGAGAASRPVLDAYVVRESDPYRVEMLIRTINNIEGRAPGQDEKLLQAGEMKRLFPHVTVAELASWFLLKPSVITDYLKVLDVERRADALGLGSIFKTDRFKKNAKLKIQINQIQSDVTFDRLVRLIAAHPHVRGQAAIDLVRNVRECSTEKRALGLIDKLDREYAELEEELRARRSRSPSGKATTFIGKILGIGRSYPGSPDKLFLAGFPAHRFPDVINGTRAAMDIIGEVLDALVKQHEENERTTEWRRTGPSSSAGISASI